MLPPVIMSKLLTNNKFPDFVYLKLSAHPLEQPSLLGSISSPTKDQLVDLKLTLRFGTQTFHVPGGYVRVRLKRGEIKLSLKNGKIPLEKMGLVAPFETTVEVEQQQTKGSELEATVAAGGSIKTKDASQQTTKVKSQASKIRNRGTENEPIWEFEANFIESPYLIGQLTDSSLGEIEINSQPCNLQAFFTVNSQKDLHLEGEGLWPKELSRNKLAVLERAFFNRFIAPKLQPYLSQVEGQL
jgi:hypothetical protein